MLDPVSGAKVTLKVSPPPHIHVQNSMGTITTGAQGKATLRLPFGYSGEWTIHAFVKTPKNGTLNYTHPLQISLQPGQKEAPLPKAPIPGPIRKPAPASTQ
jgi:hypothetical protein